MQMTSRLRDHIERLDSGVAYAADDLAVVLRAMLCASRGNRVLRRIYEGLNVEEPKLLLSKPPASGDNVIFSVGSVPVRELGAMADGADWIPLKRWADTPLMSVALGARQKVYTWANFLDDYANKWGGAHLDDVVPAYIQHVDYFAAGGLSLTSYLLRSAAVEVWMLAQHAFNVGLLSSVAKLEEGAEIGARIYAAQGGLRTLPKDRASLGQLQWFLQARDEAAFVWYVDALSQESHLRISLGQISYDVQYSPAPQGDDLASKPSPAFQTPRNRIMNEINVDSIKPSIPVSLIIKTYDEVRENALRPQNASDPSADPGSLSPAEVTGMGDSPQQDHRRD